MTPSLSISDTNNNRIFPTLEQIKGITNTFKITYTEYHKTLSEYLDNPEILDKKWSIYVKPHLKGLRPDFILLHPKKGMLIIKIIYWNEQKLDGLKKIESENKKNLFKTGGEIVPKPGDDISALRKMILDNHLTHLKNYLNKLQRDFQGGNFSRSKKHCAIRIGYFFPKVLDANRIENKFGELKIKYNNIFLISGKEIDNNINMDTIINSFDKKRNVKEDIRYYWSSRWLGKIKTKLTPSFHKSENGMKTNFSEKQTQFINTQRDTEKYLKGSAGSGKSLIIGERAARIASEKRSVLIVTFNITLKKYIEEQCKRAQIDYCKDFITINHFHGLEKLLRNTYNKKIYELMTSENLCVGLPEYWIKYLGELSHHYHDKYDAILIDEAQDFTDEMYGMLDFFKNNDEFESLIVFDEKQNIYKRNLSFLKDQDINELVHSYRIPKFLVPIINKFSQDFLGNNTDSIPSDNSSIESISEIKSYFNNKFSWDELDKIERNENQNKNPSDDNTLCSYCKTDKIPHTENLRNWERACEEEQSIDVKDYIKNDYKGIIKRTTPKNLFELKKKIGINENEDEANDNHYKAAQEKIIKEILVIIKKIRCSTCEDHSISSYEKIKDNIITLIKEGNKADDIAVMVPYRWEVDELRDHLKGEDFRTICVSTRENKIKFDRNDKGVKISTINSFKGYELSNIIILTEHNNSNLFGHEILYTSLTRTTSKLVILNRKEDYSDFYTYLENYKNSLLAPE